MLLNYLKLSFRNLRKYRLYAFINITGLSIAWAIGILIFLFIEDEKSYDQFHTRKDQLYLMEVKRQTYGEEKSIFDADQDGIWHIAWMPTGLGPAIKEEIPDIIRSTRWESGQGIFIYKEKVFEEEIHYVDPDFFLMFDFPLVSGNPEKVLSENGYIVITESIKQKYFEDQDPLGQTVELDINGQVSPFMVSGVIADPPENSSLEFNLLLRQENRPWYEESVDNWQSFNCPAFIELRPDTDLDAFKDRLLAFEDKYFGERKKDIREMEGLEEDVPVLELQTKPLTDIHMDTEVSWHKSSDPAYSYILGGIGVLILLIACINYISLALSNSSARAREVGVRKVMGAMPRNLAGQFWGESMLLVFIALITGTLLAGVLTDVFNSFTGKSLSLFNLNPSALLFFLLLLLLMVGILAGGYPALFLSRMQPVKVLKSVNTSRHNTGLIRVLVVLQFGLSVFLIVSSMIMFRQMRYITTRDLGFNEDQVLVVPTFTGWTEKGEISVNRLSEALRGTPGVLHVAGTSTSFNKGWSQNAFEINGELHSAFTYRVSHAYLKTIGLELTAGRDFDPDRPSDIQDAIIVNEALVEDYGWDNPIGQHLYWRSDSSSYLVIGVVSNYHFQSLENPIEPVILYANPGNGNVTTALIKIGSNDIPATLEIIEKTWKDLFPYKPFEYSFLDEDVAEQYTSYMRWMKIMTASTLIAIFIACLGLFGLSGINAVNRVREISIRKVLGASVQHLFFLINREVIWLAVIAFVIAVPLSYIAMEKWLQAFQYKITMEWPVYLLALLTGMLVALLTVSYHTIRIALVNPAEILKDE